MSDPAVHTVVVSKSAQVGWTECLNNIVGFHVACDPWPLMVVMPTVELGEDWSKRRLAPMLRDTPVLRQTAAAAKGRSSGNTTLLKEFPNGSLAIVGANAPSGLASKPIRILICDEVDRYPPSAGTEGDPITLARKRTNNYWNRKILLGGTPTIKGASRIETAFEASDKRRYWVPCPHCGEFQTLAWPRVKWTGDDPETARYHCGGCGAGWTDAERWAAVREGEWRAEAPFKGTAGFHINELASPWRRLAETVGDFLDAVKKPDMHKAWVNTALGETWQEAGEAPEWERLLERAEPYPMGVVPIAALVLTAGVDVQPDRLECDVWAWGPGLESWLIESRSFSGNTSEEQVWDDAEGWLGGDWPHEGRAQRIGIRKIAVDTGGKDTQATYKALRRWRDERVVPVKGVEGWNKASPVNGPTYVDVTAGGRKLKRGLQLWTVAVSTLKQEFYRQLWLARTEAGAYPPGWVHLPEGLEAEAFKQMVAEQLVTTKDRRGFAKQEWQKLRERNERLDCRVYARAALIQLGSDRYGERFWTMLARSLPVPAMTPAPQSLGEAPVAPPTRSPAPLIRTRARVFRRSSMMD